MKASRNVVAPTFQSIMGIAALALVTVLMLAVFSTRGPAQSRLGSSEAPPPVPSVPAIAGTRVAKAQATPDIPQRREVRRADFGSWHYVASGSKQGIRAVVEYDPNSIASLNAYVASNKQLAKQLAGDGKEVAVNITFRKYLSPDEFRSWATRMDIDVSYTEMRFVDSIGLSGTLDISTQPDDVSPLPQANLDAALASLQDDGRLREFRGVYFTSVTASASKLQIIADDPLVFLADVTASYVAYDLARAGHNGVKPEDVVLNVPTPIWQLERLGLMNTTK